MINELIFLAYSVAVCAAALAALFWGAQALVAYISVVIVLANVFVLKQITLGGFTATASDVLVIGSVLGLNLLQEYYGKAEAKKAILISFMLSLFYTIVCQLHLWYVPSSVDIANPHFQALFNVMPRIMAASLVTYVIVQQLDVWLYGLLRILTGGRFLVARNYLSIASSQLVDTVLFAFLGLYGLVADLGSMMLISYGVKLVALIMVGPFIALSKKVVSRP